MNQTRITKESLAAQRYLDQASTLLLSTSPHTSAFLASRRQRLSNDASQSSTLNCNSCGQILLPGWSCTTTRKTARPRKDTKTKRVEKPVVNLQSRMEYECSLCHAKTPSTVTSKPPKVNRGKVRKAVSDDSAPKAATADSTTATTTSATTATTPASTSAVTTPAPTEAPRSDRKKNRKQKQGGLQALLAKSKAGSSASSPAGFDLMDFMKMG